MIAALFLSGSPQGDGLFPRKDFAEDLPLSQAGSPGLWGGEEARGGHRPLGAQAGMQVACR